MYTLHTKTNLEVYMVMAIPKLPFCSEIRTLKNGDWKRIQAVEMKFLR
jgi:hypothetical protein